MNFIKQIALGANLTAMTNIVEQMQEREARTPIGISGIECWPLDERKSVVEEFDRRASKLSAMPRHVVTRELAKNIQLAMRMERQGRAMAIARLLEILVDRGAALPMEEFARSYG